MSSVRSSKLKLAILASGIRVGPGVDDFLARHGKPRLRVRSGSCGGLDLVLPGGTYVNCPVDELFAPGSPFLLRCSAEGLELVDERTDESQVVHTVACPDYYGRQTRHGTPLSQVGQLCSDRLGIGLTNGCVYWAREDSQCKFCSIGLNVRTGHEIGMKRTEDILDVAEAALDDPVIPAAHILLGGGTPRGADAGAVAMSDATRALKERWPGVPVYAMVAPPEDRVYIEMLIDAGVDELGINLEVWSDEAAERYLPGKRAPGRDHFLDALETAVAVFQDRRGPTMSTDVGRVRSIMIVGLEPAPQVLAGVEALASRGVMPILTPFRPMVGTSMQRHPRWSADALWEMAMAAATVAGEHGLPLGPTCIPCQANTLNVPGHPTYRAY